MKERMKKCIAILCMAALIVTMMPANIMTAKAASIKGTKIEVNQVYNGCLQNEDQIDWYTFDITHQGYFQVELGPQNPDDANIDEGWKFTVYDQNENALKTIDSITSTTTSPILPFATGMYYVKVSADNSYNTSTAPVNCTYRLSVNTVETPLWECEDNDVMTGANIINPDITYNGTLYYSDDVDYYKVNVAKNGYFTINLAAETFGDINIDEGWKCTIYDQDANAIKTIYEITSTTTSPILPFAAGTYYVKVSADNSYDTSTAPVDCTYDLIVNTIESSVWESEDNDNMTTANTISPDVVYNGNLYYSKDVDYYKVNVAKNGYFTINLAAENMGDPEIDGGWRFTIYDQYENVIKTVSSITSTTTSPILPFAAGMYYVKVNAENSYNTSTAPIDCTYNLKVNTVSSSVWESEKNDTKKTADKITLNKKTYYKGTSYHDTDEDFYKFTLSAKGKVKVTLKAEDFSELPSANYGWHVYLYNGSGTKTYDMGHFIQLKSDTVELTKGTYYLKVVPEYSYYAPVDVNYNFKVSYTKTPAKPTITKISSKNKTATIKWKKVANATGYKVYAKAGKNGKYKVVKTIKNNKTVSFTHKKLKKGKTYYYKVQAYTTKNGMTTKSAQSKYKAIVIK